MTDDHLFGVLQPEFYLNRLLFVGLKSFGDTAMLIREKKSLAIEDGSGRSNGGLRQAGDDLISFTFLLNLEFYFTLFAFRLVFALF